MTTYSLVPLSRLHPLREYSRSLALDSRPVGSRVNGDEIGLQKAFGGCTLLATHYDYFDGVSHWFYLLSGSGRVLDHVTMPDVFGFIHEVVDISSAEVSVRYFGSNDEWRIVIAPAGFWSFGPMALWRRPNRFLFSRRLLRLSRIKGPPFRFRHETAHASPQLAATDPPPQEGDTRS